MSIRLPTATVAMLVVCAVATARELPVTYAVQEKPLKVSGIAGTPLTFTLYTDNACTQQVYQAVVPIQNVTLISRLKRLTPKGAVKGPTTDELRTTLPGVTAGGNLYCLPKGGRLTMSAEAHSVPQ
jgi:hypothetical protein